MRFMIIRKADADTEAGMLPSAELIEAMGKYMDEMARAGVLIGGDGLKPSVEGTRIKFSGGEPRLIDGPFAEAKELVAGYSIIEVASKADAIAWMKRWPPIDGNGAVELEIRPLYGLDDFGDALTPELRELHEDFRTEAAKNSA